MRGGGAHISSRFLFLKNAYNVTPCVGPYVFVLALSAIINSHVAYHDDMQSYR